MCDQLIKQTTEGLQKAFNVELSKCRSELNKRAVAKHKLGEELNSIKKKYNQLVTEHEKMEKYVLKLENVEEMFKK